MKKANFKAIPNQVKIINSIDNIPVEYFKWGTYPDHFKIDMPHRHEFAELLFFTKGGGWHEIDCINYDVHENSIHFIPKSTVHFLRREKQSNGFTIAFNTEYLENNAYHKFINPFTLEPFVINLSGDTFITLLNQVKILIQSIKMEKGFYKQKCFLLSLELLLNTIASEKYKQNNKPDIHIHSDLTRKFKDLVKKYFHHQRSVAWYASQLHTSPNHLGNHIKLELKETAKSYIIKALLFSVKRNLLYTNKSISHIAFNHNVNNVYLSKLFKKHVGYTMSAYRSNKKVEK